MAYLLESMPEPSHEMILDAASKSLICQNMLLDGVCEAYLSEEEVAAKLSLFSILVQTKFQASSHQWKKQKKS